MVADCCLPLPPVISAGCCKGLGKDDGAFDDAVGVDVAWRGQRLCDQENLRYSAMWSKMDSELLDVARICRLNWHTPSSEQVCELAPNKLFFFGKIVVCLPLPTNEK